jgi:MtN3 and saliva related transmembrane protein
MDVSEIIGIIAGIATTGSFIPQAYKVYKTKKTLDLSTGMFILLIGGIIMWIIYGIQLEKIPIIAANSVTLVFAIYILVMKIKHG